MGGVVEEYLRCVADHDWAGLAACLADEGFTRIGPYGDTYATKAEYLEFISELMPTLPGYAMDVAAVTYFDRGRRALAELTETVEVAGVPTRTPEALVFGLAADGRVGRIEIYIQRLGPTPS